MFLRPSYDEAHNERHKHASFFDDSESGIPFPSNSDFEHAASRESEPTVPLRDHVAYDPSTFEDMNDRTRNANILPSPDTRSRMPSVVEFEPSELFRYL